MNGPGSIRRERLVRAIEVHLETHPRAADSADGVARWWLAPQGIEAPVEEVAQALDALVERGALRRVRLADGSTLYSREPPARPH